VPKPPSQPAPTSAIESELFQAASPLRTPGDQPRSLASSLPRRNDMVRREFTIPVELDEYLGYHLVPYLRRLTSKPVSRSTVVRAVLRALYVADCSLADRLGSASLLNESSQAVDEQIAGMFIAFICRADK
jgi:hypothetical protein